MVGFYRTNNTKKFMSTHPSLKTECIKHPFTLTSQQTPKEHVALGKVKVKYYKIPLDE